MQFNHDAALRSQVSTLAYDIADRIRLSGNLAANYVKDYQAGGAKPAVCNNAIYPGSADNVDIDISCWYESVDSALPPGSEANVTYNATADEYTITIGWTDRERQVHNIEYTFTL